MEGIQWQRLLKNLEVVDTIQHHRLHTKPPWTSALKHLRILQSLELLNSCNNSKDVSLSPKPWVEVGPSHRPASLTARARPSLRDQSVRMLLHQPHFHVLLPPGQAQKKLVARLDRPSALTIWYRNPKPVGKPLMILWVNTSGRCSISKLKKPKDGCALNFLDRFYSLERKQNKHKMKTSNPIKNDQRPCEKW